ncbi:hypothetical protein DFP73DRAFT_543401 [Morchella snyderi]|nr:hypothetical protein DFP73DRAFT_543401 [Morchella snyderi]
MVFDQGTNIIYRCYGTSNAHFLPPWRCCFSLSFFWRLSCTACSVAFSARFRPMSSWISRCSFSMRSMARRCSSFCCCCCSLMGGGGGDAIVSNLFAVRILLHWEWSSSSSLSVMAGRKAELLVVVVVGEARAWQAPWRTGVLGAAISGGGAGEYLVEYVESS